MKKKVRDPFLRQLDFANGHFSFTDCPCYPCHEMGGSELHCLFCYCLFYPCGDKKKGGRWIAAEGCAESERVWDCSGCVFVHRGGSVKKILEMIYENKRPAEIWKKLGAKRGKK